MDEEKTVTNDAVCRPTSPGEHHPTYATFDLQSIHLPNGLATCQQSNGSDVPSYKLPTTTPLAELPSTDEGRLVLKRGAYNIECWTTTARGGVGGGRCAKYRILTDAFTALVEIRWRYVGLLYIAVFTLGWIMFGLIWWGVVVAHEDHLHENDTNWKPCLSHIYNFPDALLFSIDLQSTMGYGFGEIETECPMAVLLFMIQCVFGVFVECAATGIVFSKLIRPKRRYQTIMFSDRVVVYLQPDGLLMLQFRVGDMRRRCLIAASVSAVMVKAERTKEGLSL